VAMSAEPLRDVRDHFSEVVDRVEHHHERVTVTRNGRPVAVLISPDDLAELEETLDARSGRPSFPTGCNGCALRCSKPVSHTATAPATSPPRHVHTPTSASSATTSPPAWSSSPHCEPNSPTSPSCARTHRPEAGTPKSPDTPASARASPATSTDSHTATHPGQPLDTDRQGRLIERFFAYVTADLLQRSDHRSVQALERDIRNWVKGWNENPKPFIWTKPAEQILESLKRLLQRTTDAGH
jgi:prevent-host-death family protein